MKVSDTELRCLRIERALATGAPEPSCVRLTLTGSKGNILTRAAMEELRKSLAAIKQDPTVKAVIITGEGKHFSFGASVEEHTRVHAADMIHDFHGLIQDIATLGIPVISVVSGYCLGGAMEVVLATNLIFADETAVFGQPEIKLGVFPPPASLLLPLKIGYGRAEEVLLTGENIPAASAYAMGLVNRLYQTTEALRDGADDWIRTHLLPKSASSLRFATQAERSVFTETLRVHLPRLERLYVHELMETHDANEGIAAFLEKRKPEWMSAPKIADIQGVINESD
ncbi:MAG: enoyl-CoA hydratase/isomerase family protein [Bacteroidota bacterium]|nr:enoyl-CoA hydratase/isomerase family protein [Bacteroidota bacterium]MDP4233216.1 enoyl-CoA hydratase/isomerase family protein [Bacteroidota bacterium]MDP4242165.1 enoyl-CoA hydratase/isomerase family protein [Bacteroidota bacterium]